GCGAGVNSFHVDPKGTLLSCEALPLNGYDLRTGTFKEGWYGIVGDIRRRLASERNVCARCDLKSMCDRCPATPVLETGSPDGWIPYYCEVTHRRAALFEDAIGNHEKALEYAAHAQKVAGGWTPPGAILPGGRKAGAGTQACAGGGCATSGCGRSVTGTPGPDRLIQIDLPPVVGGDKEAGR